MVDVDCSDRVQLFIRLPCSSISWGFFPDGSCALWLMLLCLCQTICVTLCKQRFAFHTQRYHILFLSNQYEYEHRHPTLLSQPSTPHSHTYRLLQHLPSPPPPPSQPITILNPPSTTTRNPQDVIPHNNHHPPPTPANRQTIPVPLSLLHKTLPLLRHPRSPLRHPPAYSSPLSQPQPRQIQPQP